jgi:hypothetical protein
MSLNLSCPCGYQGVASPEEAQELIWCPQCRKVLHQPRSYTAGQGRQFTSGGGRPLAPQSRPTPSGGSTGGSGGRIGAGIAVAVVLGVMRAACMSSSYHDTDYTPTYTPPRFDPVIVQQPPQVDWNQFNGAQPDPRFPFGGANEVIIQGDDGKPIRVQIHNPGPGGDNEPLGQAKGAPGGNPFGKPPGGPLPEDDR